MKRSMKLPLLVALALGSGHAFALDLGQIQVKSALGQPLLAEIPVHKATAAELQQLNVQLASGDEFNRAGVAGGRPSMPLQFKVVDAGHGHKVIRITSEVAVNDPFLDLLLEIHGGHGKSVREYTILLDPPGSSPAMAASPATPPSPAKPAPAPVPAAPTAGAGGQVANGQFGPVQRGQTLSMVAQRTLPAGVDVDQMVLALKQANPGAFYRDNINALKAGAVLRIPSKSEAEALAVAAAAAEVRRQNGDWRNASAGTAPTTVADAGTRAGTSSSPTISGAGKGDHLALVPPKQGGKSAGGNGSDKLAAMHQDLLRSQEVLANLQQQSDNLKSRLKDLNDINSKNQRLLALKDSEIAELQQKLAAARKAAGMPAAAATAPAAAAPGAKPTPAIAPAPAPATAGTAKPEIPAAAATAAQPATMPVKAEAPKPAPAAKPEPAKQAAPEPAKPAPAETEAWYQQTWVQGLGGGALVLLLLLLALGRRNKGKPAAPAKGGSSLADRFGGAMPPPVAADGDDVDQNLLLDQLAEHPDDINLHLELVSLYYSRRDVEHFEAAAEAMQAHVSDPQQDEWQEVLHMGRDLVPGHPLFAEHAEAAPAAPHDEPVAAPAVAAAPAVPPPFPANPVKVSEYNFNFDLTPAQDAPAHPAHPAEPEAPLAAPASDEDATVMRPAAHDWSVELAPESHLAGEHEAVPHEFGDDPVDTKLDLARAYLDMGDPDGARSMLEEALKEGSQSQRDIAKRMLDDLH
jgi:pilus assembly protein FimV